MRPFDVILFDVGGVLLTNSWDVRQRAAAAEHFQLDEIELQKHHAAVFESWERGEIAMAAYLDQAVFYRPRDFSRDEFVACMFSQSELLPDGALEILKELATHRPCLLGALNNESRELNEHRFSAFGLRQYFNVAFSSCYVGLRKPGAEIYRLAIDVLGARPERILFIDDRTENVAGAQQAGITALRFSGADALKQELNRLGVFDAAAD